MLIFEVNQIQALSVIKNYYSSELESELKIFYIISICNLESYKFNVFYKLFAIILEKFLISIIFCKMSDLLSNKTIELQYSFPI